MNFTREPIIETVITPKEGCKLVVRNSKGGGQEEFFVDAVEVVSFGNSLFFRSTERPKTFLVPVSDYEILELKETRMVLKNVAHDRSIKIGGGRDSSRQKESSESEEDAPKKREKRRPRRRKKAADPDKQQPEKQQPEMSKAEAMIKGTDEPEEEKKEMKKLFPPPPKLIKDRLSSYKTAEILAEDIIPKEIRQMKKGDKAAEKENLKEDIPKPPSPPKPPEAAKSDIEESPDLVEKAPEAPKEKEKALANKEKE